MAGLVGLTTGRRSPGTCEQTVRSMQDLLAYTESCRKDELFCDRVLCATRAATNIIQKEPQPHREAETYVWLDGEIYNREELAREANLSVETDAALLVALYRQHEDFSFLKKIDGIYAAIIYDARGQKLHLVTDRYGLRHLFWTVQDESIAWASEVKAMLALPGFDPKIDLVALNDFLSHGHMRGDRTWFEGVELLSAGTVLTWDEKERSIHKQRYWWWDQIKPLAGKIDENELAEELGRLFLAAVERRSLAGERVGLTLSGGLDSRAILAAMPERGDSIHTVTFGRAGCEDLSFAADAARLKGAIHHTVELSAMNWLKPRPLGVWQTDGELDLMHMHVMTVIPRLRELFDIGLDGLAANGIIGDAAEGDSESAAIEYVDNRARRFLILGPTSLRGYTEERFPFFDNDFMSLAFAVPARLKAHNIIYRKMLLKTFPEFFDRIPWQRTGAPVKWPGRREELVRRLNRLPNKALRVAIHLGLYKPRNRGYADYPGYIRQEPGRSFFKSALLNPSALYSEYVPQEQVQSDLVSHLNGEDRSESLCRILTLEIWLQQVFEAKYRPTPDAQSDYAMTGVS